jgi:hypothetical protein
LSRPSVSTRLPAGPPFVASDEALLLALGAKTWGVRPSSLLTISEPVVALALDDALLQRLIAAHASTKPRADVPPPPGSRYETLDDLGVPLWNEARARERAAAHEQKLRREGRIH